jgi:hypothetical protein
MNSSSHRYLSCWPRHTTTAPLRVTILMYCTKGQQRRRPRGTMAPLAPTGLTLVTPQVTHPLRPRVERQSTTIEGGKSSIFVDDARNVCKETFSCSVLRRASPVVSSAAGCADFAGRGRLRWALCDDVLEKDQWLSLPGKAGWSVPLGSVRKELDTGSFASFSFFYV